MPKDTGKKLADMLYGQNPEQAAFGVYPQMKGRRSKQDPEAAKNVPVDLLRGAVSGVLGAPGDIESLIRLLPGLEERTILPTSEDIEKRLPFKSDTPVSRAATGIGQIGGGFYTGPGSPLRLVGALPGAVKRAGQDFAMAAGQSGPNVIKPKGGNWLTGDVENAIANLKSPTTAGETPAQRIPRHEELLRDPSLPPESRAVVELHLNAEKKRAALDKWVESNLTNYIKNQMATPDDPVRKLAEQGITHKSDLDAYRRTPGRTLTERREAAGFPAEGLGQSELARVWENLADYSFMSKPAKDVSAERYPWVSKLDPETPVYGGIKKDTSTELAFDHILDVLREDLASGRIRPEQLNKVSMEQAVRRTYEYDQEMAKKMREAQVKATEGMPVYKEYPEGFRWVELAGKKSKPEIVEMEGGGWTIKDNTGHLMSGGFKSKEGAEKALAQLSKTDKRYKEGISQESEKALEDALKYEGETMGHCVGGYCPDVLEGRSRIFSLRDAKGEPHVTIEVEPAPRIGFREGEGPKTPEERFDLQTEWLKGVESGKIGGDVTFANWWRQKNNIPEPELPFQISQIKGKQNRAPKEDYLPFVQDFVKSGQWSDVGDLQNTGLIRRGNVFTPTEKQGLIDLGQDVPEYLTQEDIARLRRARGDLPPEEGMAHGGSVHISDNPDVMQMELAGGGEVHMDEGGAAFGQYTSGKKYQAAKKRAEDADVNLLKDPKTYAAVQGLLGVAPDEMGFSVLHPKYQEIKEVADPAFAVGSALQVMPAAKPGALALAKKGERLAERAVPGIMERGGLPADILSGMAQGSASYAYRPHTPLKPDPEVGTRYKKQYVGGLAPRQDLNIEDLEKSSAKIFPWDATSRNQLITEVSDVPLTKPVLTEGGDEYMMDLQHIKDRIAGASNFEIAKRIKDRIDQAAVENQLLGGTGKVYGFPIRMGERAENFSTFPTDIAMDLLRQGGLNKKELKALTEDIRTMAFEGKQAPFRNAAPVGTPEFDIQLREGLEKSKNKKGEELIGFTPGNLRKGLMDRLSKVEYQKRLGYNQPDLVGAVLSDELKGVPKGYVGNVAAELDPFTSLRPSKSSSYSHDFGGQYVGSMPNMPVEFLMPNTFEGMYLEMKAKYPSATPEALRNMAIGAMEKRKEKISEMIGPRTVDAVKTFQEGLMKGEFDPNDIKQVYDYMRRKKLQLKMADGGEVHGLSSQDMLFLQSQDDLAKLSPQAQREYITNMGGQELRQRMAPKYADGGEITADDLILEERKL